MCDFRSLLVLVSQLLEVDEKRLGWALVNYVVVRGGEVVRGMAERREAEGTRDSLARSLYARLLDSIVNLINSKLSLSRLLL